ncbi:Ficolin-1-A [Bulinus truncatus]|nr:Ficolin-1-A [Bulinus truncatus]
MQIEVDHHQITLKVMINYLRFVAALLTLLTVYLPGKLYNSFNRRWHGTDSVSFNVTFNRPCSCSITAEFNDTNCPEPMEYSECRRGMLSTTQYLLVHSKKFNTKFLCDTRTDGGGWIVFLRRVHGDTSFNQSWSLYKDGFGSVCSDYWLGNKYINLITELDKYELRVDMTYKNKEYYACYKFFEVGGELNKYALHVDPKATAQSFSAQDGGSTHATLLY